MRRRDFISALGGAAAWPLTARAQQPMLVIGFLLQRTRRTTENLVTALRQGLRPPPWTGRERERAQIAQSCQLDKLNH